MKKICGGMLFLLSIACIVLLILSNQKNPREKLYSLYEYRSYVIKEKNDIVFDIYSDLENSLVSMPRENQYTLELEDRSIVLENVQSEIYPAEDKTIIRLYAPMPKLTDSEYTSSVCRLHIENARYTVNLDYGQISFLKEDYYPLVTLSHLEASYSYLNSVLTLVGLNIELATEAERMESLRLGNEIIGDVRGIKWNEYYPNIVEIQKNIPGYNPIKNCSLTSVALKSKRFFIPMTYSEIGMFRRGYTVLSLDGESYYFDTFDYMANLLSYTEYEPYMKEGEIRYVKTAAGV